MADFLDPTIFSSIDPKDLIVQPLERAETIPSSWYYDEKLYKTEQEIVFASQWQLVTSLDRLPEIGSHVCAAVAGEPVIVVRDKEDQIRSFYNVCRHRGGPLATEDGCSTMLKCKYHGWTYQLDGMLRGVPDFDRVDLFDKKDYGLLPIPTTVWENFVFVRLQPSSPTFEELVHGISDRTINNPLHKKRLHTREAYSVKCNWKVYVDNYLEGYHVPIVHPELVKIYEFNKYRTTTYDWYSLQDSPLDPKDNMYAVEGGEALYYFIYPNLMLNILPGRLQTNLVLPTSPTTCDVLFDYYYDDIATPRAQQFIKEDIEFSHSVQLEDIEICELVQRGLQSRAYNKGRFSVKRENAVHHFQTLLKSAFREYFSSMKQ